TMGRPGTKRARLEESAALAQAGTVDADALGAAIGRGETPEAGYGAAAPLPHRRRFAQFFTPPKIAALMAEWAIAPSARSLLDPALGMGVLVRAALARKNDLAITAFEKDPLILRAFLGTRPDLGKIEPLLGDFLTHEPAAPFDAVLMNPPYLRHHDLNYEFDIFEEFSRRHRLKISRLSNAYLLFVVKACAGLNPGGRASVIIPTEWMNANFGTAMKEFLIARGYLRQIIYFSNCSDIFDDALTTACVLLLERPQAAPSDAAAMPSVVAWYLHGVSSEAAPDSLEALRRAAKRSEFSCDTLLRTEKWDFLIREGAQEAAGGFVELRWLARTKRGIATGSNEFFHLSPSQAAAHALPPEVLRPCVGRAADIAGFEFDGADFDALKRADRRTYLLTFNRELTAAERAYIAGGEARGIHDRYLLAGRKPWYTTENQDPAPIWAAVFGRRGLRFVHNKAACRTLTTFHCVYPFDASPDFAAALTLCLNLPSVQARARAHTRVYGGGLLKVEPKDLLSIAVPDLRRVEPETLRRLARMQARIVAQCRAQCRRGGETDLDWRPAEDLVKAAAGEAAAKGSATRRDGTAAPPPLPQPPNSLKWTALHP
ncbi:MAG: N-6 DNA methylase, partial [Rhodospirillaceae bacterium]|nr:N-6 DNA methylase [Rhodospirillaceae bacterium]